ncbi:MAG: helix-turn-helix transcriptional regulator, partial [Clostridiales bacterium]|nr:helix-turn-helix transcriptional regulator [Clostridiales bacterium]
GQNLRSFRKRMGLTQKQAADIFGVTSGALSNYERSMRAPDIHTLMEMANLYDTSIDALLGLEYACSNTIAEGPIEDIEDILGPECIDLIYEIGQLDEEEKVLLLYLLEGIKARKETRSF